MSVALAIREAAAALAKVSDTPRLDAELLMAHVLGVSRSEMLLGAMGEPVPAGIAGLVMRRLRHEPVAQIVGRQEFYGIEFIVTPEVLIPRADSETLIEAARARFSGHQPKRILDLGLGSGALLLTALHLWPQARGVGVERSLAALAVAAANAGRLGLAGRARLLRGDWDRPGWADDLGRFDLILANPPYVEDDAELAPEVRNHEPAGALYAGPEGLEAHRAIVPQLPALLEDDGVAVLEIGPTQAAPVTALAAPCGLAATLHRDLADRPRALEFKKALGKPAATHYLEAKPAGG
ncbi:MAG: peptide chain release factor N(5)-glutamine methyltransferase [Novosphingobium sp.]|nr:peptide chain release factor N(5)-glutamine methyltransferase [Novosphingobium sp.]